MSEDAVRVILERYRGARITRIDPPKPLDDADQSWRDLFEETIAEYRRAEPPELAQDSAMNDVILAYRRAHRIDAVSAIIALANMGIMAPRSVDRELPPAVLLTPEPASKPEFHRSGGVGRWWLGED